VADASAAPGGVLGIVTVLFGGDDVIDGFFGSLAVQDVDLRLYVVDNNPTPSVIGRCRELASRHGIAMECVLNDRNVGVATGNNQGIRLALRDRCRWVLLANNDVEFPPGTLAALLAPLRAGEMAVTPKILYPGPERRVWFAGGRLDRWTRPTEHLGAGMVDQGQFDRPGYTEYASTCFLGLASGVFDRVGLMDEAYFVYYDDTDFAWRLRAEGIRIRYEPAATVIHKVGGATGGTRSPFTTYYGHRNRIYFMRKHFRGPERWVGLGYFLLSRVPKTAATPRPLARRMWAGVRDGLRLPVSRER